MKEDNPEGLLPDKKTGFPERIEEIQIWPTKVWPPLYNGK